MSLSSEKRVIGLKMVAELLTSLVILGADGEENGDGEHDCRQENRLRGYSRDPSERREEPRLDR